MTKRMGERQRANRRSWKLVNAEEAAEILGVSRRTVCRWAKAGRMPNRGGTWHLRLRLYRQTDIEELARCIRTGSTTAGNANND